MQLSHQFQLFGIRSRETIQPGLSAVLAVELALVRKDIQALRGWAVCLVVLEHFELGPFRLGFLGVDIFFVISGFLITSNILRDLNSGSFSFQAFYFRRAKRLFPAAFVTIAACALASPFFLTSLELSAFIWQVIGAFGFFINLILYAQADYFAVEAELKPLLHLWSLSIEEQFYVLFPALLVFTPARWRMVALAIMGIGSLVVCLVWLQKDAQAAFYFLPGRAWELSLGAFAAVLQNKTPCKSYISQLTLFSAVALLTVVPMLPLSLPHPGFLALAVCLAAFAVIHLGKSAEHPALAIPLLALIGNFSYSLYLVHWPIIAFVRNANFGSSTLALRLAGLVASFMLALLLYSFVEKPIRNLNFDLTRKLVVGWCAFALGIVIFPWSARYWQPDADAFAQLRQPNYGLGKPCDSAEPFVQEGCRTSQDPELLIWGDSFAMHLVGGIAAQSTSSLEQATFSMCAPIIGLAVNRPEIKDPAGWAQKCMTFNDEVIGMLSSTSSRFKTVVVSSQFSRLNGPTQVWTRKEKGQIRLTWVTPDEISEALRQTVNIIKEAGVHVTVVGPPPSVGKLDFSVCHERLKTGKFVVGNADCVIPRAEAETVNRTQLQRLSKLALASNVEFVDLYEVLCNEVSCKTAIDGVVIYRDAGHLSREGSIKTWELLQSRFPSIALTVSGASQKERAPVRDAVR